jgi:hypothetical protein
MELRKAIVKDYAPKWKIIWLEIIDKERKDGKIPWFMTLGKTTEAVKKLNIGDRVLVDVDESDNNLFYLKELE